MADNFVTNPAAGGDTFAADDIAGVKWQRVKLGQGVDGSATDVSSASPLPVDTELPAAAALSDSTANPTAPMVGAAGMVYNGASFDRQRGNTEGTLLASGSRYGSVSAVYVTNYNSGRGLFIWLDVTVPNGTAETLNVFVAGVNPVNAKKTYLTKTGLVYTQNEGAKCLGWVIAPGTIADADNVDASTANQVRKVTNSFVPRYWALDVFAGGGTTASTFSVGYSLI